MIQVYISDNLIPQSDIKKQPTLMSQMTFADNVISSEGEVVLNNVSGQYSDMNSISIFYGASWYNKVVRCYDDVEKQTLMVGLIRNITQDDNSGTVTVKFVNYIQQLSEVKAVASYSAVTPAKAIYDLILYAGVPVEYVADGTFAEVEASQTGQSILVDVTYAASDSASCITVINELLRMTSCSLYTLNNVINIKEWEEITAGEIGTQFKSYLIPNSLNTYYDETVFNAYSIAYDVSGTVSLATGTAHGTDGTKLFTVPDKNIDSTSSSKFKILLQNVTGATACGEKILKRMKNPRKYLTISSSEKYADVIVGDQMDLTAGDYLGEPATIQKKEQDTSTGIIKWTAEFRNLPVNVITRDITPPDAPEIIVLPWRKGIVVKTSISSETDWFKYLISFTSNTADYESDYCQLGKSPIDSIITSTTPDGYHYTVLTQLRPNIKYYAKAQNVDTALNESSYSVSKWTIPHITSEDFYNCSGNYIEGVSIDINAVNTISPADAKFYGDGTYGNGAYGFTGYYKTPEIIYSDNIINNVLFAGSDKLKYSYRTYDGTAWSTWSVPTTCAASNNIAVDDVGIQIIIYFYVSQWSNQDKFYIKEVL
jgi:hypothetical protein